MFSLSRGGDTATAPVTAPRVPSVNLLPPEIAEAAKFRRVQLAMGGAVAAAVVVVGALYMHEHSGVKAAQDELTAAQQQQTALQSKLNSLASVQDVYTQVDARKAMLASAMAPQIRWSYYLTDLSMKVPDNVWLTQVGATENPPSSTATSTVPGTTPTDTIGTMQFAGVAFSHDDVATWLDVLGREPGMDQAYFTQSTEAFIGPKKVVNFASTTNLTADAQHRTKPAGS